MHVLDVDEGRSKNINLTPVKTHVDEDNFVQVSVHKLSQVFVIKVKLVDFVEFISSESNNSEVV
jgi:hypothetical protein